MKAGRITGALGGLFGMIGSIANAARRDPIAVRERQSARLHEKVEKLRAKAKHEANPKKRDILLARALGIEKTLRRKGMSPAPEDGLP